MGELKVKSDGLIHGWNYNCFPKIRVIKVRDALKWKSAYGIIYGHITIKIEGEIL